MAGTSTELTLAAVRGAMRALAKPQREDLLQKFFRAMPGGYGEGDRFLGLTVPQTRSVVKQFRQLPLAKTRRLLESPWHEERLCALLIMVEQFRRGDEAARRAVYEAYCQSFRLVNNWDLVDSSASYIAGAWLLERPRDRKVLRTWARSDHLWTRRISIVSMLRFVAEKEFDDAIELAQILRDDPHDLIHKAVGWVLREMGKRDMAVLRGFLDRHAKQMPRTMLRYAIEKLAERERQAYMQRD